MVMIYNAADSLYLLSYLHSLAPSYRRQVNLSRICVLEILTNILIPRHLSNSLLLAVYYLIYPHIAALQHARFHALD